MHGSLLVRFLALTLVLTAGHYAAAQEDPWKKDHPMVPRYPGSEPLGSPGQWRDFDEFTLVLGKVTGEGAAVKTQKVEGRVYTVTYGNPEGRSVLEIYRNYEQGLLKAGFQELYSCVGEPCGAGATVGETQFDDPSYVRRFLVGKLPRAQGDVYVSLLVQAQAPNMTGATFLAVIETKPMQTGLVKVDAGAMNADIGATGHVALYGIYFDTGKSIVKPESNQTLQEIAKLLASNATLKLHVVGHTDSVGDLSANMELSRQRASAVVQALTTRFAVASGRLHADGVGPLAPVASNRGEPGRAKNRRVELVEQ
jgi:OOP family OmpA-OmpF porin